MGIVNLTDDSFFEGSRFASDADGSASLLSKVEEMIGQGADMIDMGGCSTRPGSTPVSIGTEWERLEGALKAVRSHFPDIPLSVDSFRAEIIRRSFDAVGPITANDVSGAADPLMLKTVSELSLPYIATFPFGGDPVEFFSEFSKKAKKEGIGDWILDPGLGFGKTIRENWRILRDLPRLRLFHRPILVGLSRKSMLTSPLGISAGDALCASAAANLIALQKGADILRVHDVKEAFQVIKLYRLSTEDNISE